MKAKCRKWKTHCLSGLFCLGLQAGEARAHTLSHVFAELNWSQRQARILVRLDLKEVMGQGPSQEEIPWDYTHAWVQGLKDQEKNELGRKLFSQARQLLDLQEGFTLEPDPGTAGDIMREDTFFKAAEGEVLLSMKVMGNPAAPFRLASSIRSGKPLMLSVRLPPPRPSRVEVLPAGVNSAAYPLIATPATPLRATGTAEEQLAQGLVEQFRHGWRIICHGWPLLLAVAFMRGSLPRRAGPALVMIALIMRNLPALSWQEGKEIQGHFLAGGMISLGFWTGIYYLCTWLAHRLIMSRHG